MKQLSLLFVIQFLFTGLLSQTALPPAEGVGSENNPYQIATLENLYWIAADNDEVPTPNQAARWSSHYIQTADIDASETENWFDGAGWRPIGAFDTDHPYFSGLYNGQNHTIGNLYINRPNSNNIGLTGFALGATIENLGVTNVNITGDKYVGGLVGFQDVSSIISNSYSTGSVTGTGSVGGLAGCQRVSSIITSYSTVNVSGKNNVGGLVGFSDLFSIITNSHNKGSVSGNDKVGGLVGSQFDSTISNSYSAGSVCGDWQVGGLVGNNSISSIITNSYNKGIVSGNVYVGGLVGRQFHSTISDSYSIGSVNGDDEVGGLVGSQSYSSTIKSYWNIETSGQTDSAGGEGRNTAEMTYPYAANTYVNWDFEEIWVADVYYDVNEGYPYLQGIDDPVSVKDDVFVVIKPNSLTNYPNPFNPETTISYSIPQDVEELSLIIYNIRGRIVRILVDNAPHPEGEHQVVWDGRNDLGKPATSGVYFYKMTTPDIKQVNKMILLK